MIEAEAPLDAVDALAKATSAAVAERAGRSLAVRAGKGMVSTAISVVVVVGAWALFLRVFHINHFVGKGPLDVWRYLFTSADAGTHRSEVLRESFTTLRDAGVGLMAGSAAAVACALAFNLCTPIERTVMPLAMVLRSVPLIAMTPLIVLIFGRNVVTIAIIAGIVTFFPTLVNVSLALRWAPRDSLDLCRAYGASHVTTLRKVQVPNSLPALLASLRIAAPLALVGALLAEWLATGKGLGYRILQVGALSDYNGLWSRVALATLYSFALYKLIGAVERIVLKRFAPIA